MKNSPQSGAERGFTIIEVLLVLAVSGLILTSAAFLFNGKQATTEFDVAANQFQTQLQSTINDAGNGYNPTSSIGTYTYNFTCTGQGNAVNGTPSFTENGITSPGTGQGTNGGAQGCIFLGRVVQFSASSTVNIYTIVGDQYVWGSNPSTLATGITDASPILLANATSPTNQPFLPAASQFTLEYGAQILCIQTYATTLQPFQSASCNPGSTTIGAIAFAVGSDATSGAASGTTDNSVPADSFIPLGSPVSFSSPGSSIVANINSALLPALPATLDVNPAGGVYICLTNSTQTRSALISIGANYQEPVVNMKMHTSSGACG
jgi:prepilin-type N-terminal cleavage/methylation domain-containing protein